MRLTELAPHMIDHRPNEHGFQRFSFLCPSCRKLRETLAIWSRRFADVNADGEMVRVWEATQGPGQDWDTLSLTPSVNLHPHRTCPGWHGYITDGEVR